MRSAARPSTRESFSIFNGYFPMTPTNKINSTWGHTVAAPDWQPTR